MGTVLVTWVGEASFRCFWPRRDVTGEQFKGNAVLIPGTTIRCSSKEENRKRERINELVGGKNRQ